jgi:hypothetical protein
LEGLNLDSFDSSPNFFSVVDIPSAPFPQSVPSSVSLPVPTPDVPSTLHTLPPALSYSYNNDLELTQFRNKASLDLSMSQFNTDITPSTSTSSQLSDQPIIQSLNIDSNSHSPSISPMSSPSSSFLPTTTLSSPTSSFISLGSNLPMSDPLPNVQSSCLSHSMSQSVSQSQFNNDIETHPPIWLEFIFMVLFWAYKGIEVDMFYHLQTIMFGVTGDSDPNAPSPFSSAGAFFHLIFALICKIFIDVFVYDAIWGTPTSLIIYRWKDCNFSFYRTKLKFQEKKFWFWSMPQSIISLWIVWIPVLACVYQLPDGLQLVMYNIAACFWSILLSMISNGGGGPH